MAPTSYKSQTNLSDKSYSKTCKLTGSCIAKIKHLFGGRKLLVSANLNPDLQLLSFSVVYFQYFEGLHLQ